MRVAVVNQEPSSTINRFDLQVGQWVIFHTEKPHESLTETQQNVYDKIFLVLTRDDSAFDSCYCQLIGEDGNTYNYTPSRPRLGRVILINDYSVFVISFKNVKLNFGDEKILSIYSAAQEYLESNANYYREFRVSKLDIESLKTKLITHSKEDEKDYSPYCIPPDVLRFFSEEKGLNPEMLLMDSYRGRDKKYCCGIIDGFKTITFPLIKFYLATPQLSVEDLLNYNELAIRDFAIYDENLQFHKWLLRNQLTMPHALVAAGGKWGNIYSLCDYSGIEYLNRKILPLSKDQRQSKLNELVLSDCAKDKETCLQDSLVSPAELKWSTVENRFLKFKEKETETAKKHTNGPMSLLWLAAKAVSKTISQEELDNLPEKLQSCVKAARPFGSLS